MSTRGNPPDSMNLNGSPILVVTNMYPSVEAPDMGTFVASQVEGLRRIGLSVQVFEVDRSGRGPLVYRGLGTAVRHAAKESDAVLVHAMYGGFMAEAVTRAVEVPTVVSFCGADLLREPLRIVQRVSARAGILASWCAAARASQVIVKSEGLGSALPRWIERTKVHVVPNGVDLTRFKPMNMYECRSQLQWPPEEFSILFYDSGDPTKRRALAEASVEVLRRELGVSVRLRTLRGVPHEEVPIWLNAADVVLCTSATEGSPNVIKEALACEVPIVSVPVGDVERWLAPVKGCYLTDPDPVHIADCLSLVAVEMNHRREGALKQRREGSRAAGREIMADFSVEAVAEEVRAVYVKALGAAV